MFLKTSTLLIQGIKLCRSYEINLEVQKLLQANERLGI
jgi:hypothetical protein